MLNIPNADKAREKCNIPASSEFIEKVYDYNATQVEREIDYAISNRKREVTMSIANRYYLKHCRANAHLIEEELKPIALRIQEELLAKGYRAKVEKDSNSIYWLTIKW